MALHSSFVIFCLGVLTFFSMVFTLPLSSSTSPCPSFGQTFSTAVILYIGGALSITAKFGPQANRLSCVVDKGLLEMFMTHLALGFVPFTVVVVSGVILTSPSVSCCFGACLPWLPCRSFEQPPLFLWHNQLNLFTCLVWVLMCLDSLLVLMNTIHSSMESLSKMPFSQFIHVSI